MLQLLHVHLHALLEVHKILSVLLLLLPPASHEPPLLLFSLGGPKDEVLSYQMLDAMDQIFTMGRPQALLHKQPILLLLFRSD